MFDSSKTMKEIVEADPLFGEFLVHKGFPFSLDNPIVEYVTFDDVASLKELDSESFLAEYRVYVGEVEEAIALDF